MRVLRGHLRCCGDVRPASALRADESRPVSRLPPHMGRSGPCAALLLQAPLPSGARGCVCVRAARAFVCVCV